MTWKVVCSGWAIIIMIMTTGLALPTQAADPTNPCDGGYTLQVPLPQIGGVNVPTCFKGGDAWALYIQAWYTILLYVTAMVAVVMIIIGGIRWAVAFGDSGKISLAQETIREAIIGLMLMLLSITLLQFVNPGLTTLSGLPGARSIPPSSSQIQNAPPAPTVQSNIPPLNYGAEYGCCLQQIRGGTANCRNIPISDGAICESGDTASVQSIFTASPCSQAPGCGQISCPEGQQCGPNKICKNNACVQNTSCAMKGESCYTVIYGEVGSTEINTPCCPGQGSCNKDSDSGTCQ